MAKLDHHFFTWSLVILSLPHLFHGLLSKLFIQQNCQWMFNRVFERQLYLHFLFRFAKIWSITYQRTKEAQIIQLWFLLALEYLHANQAPDPCLNIRVTQKLNIVNLQTSKGLEYHALTKGHFFRTDLFPVAYFCLKNLNQSWPLAFQELDRQSLADWQLPSFLAILTVSRALHPGVQWWNKASTELLPLHPSPHPRCNF